MELDSVCSNNLLISECFARMITEQCPPALWQSTLPHELLHGILQTAAQSGDSYGVDLETACALRLVNSDVNRLIEPILFHTWVIRSVASLDTLLKGTKLSHANRAMLHVRRVVLFPNSFPLTTSLSYGVRTEQWMRLSVPKVILDFTLEFPCPGTFGCCGSLALGLRSQSLQIKNLPAPDNDYTVCPVLM